MCFRPAGVTKPVQCPICKAWNKPTATECKKCGYKGEEKEDSSKK